MWFARLGACAAVAVGAMVLTAGPSPAKGNVASVVKQTLCDVNVNPNRACVWELPSQ